MVKGILAAAAAAFLLAAPMGASAQSIQIGPDGVRVLPPEQSERYERRERRREVREISTREAARIARGAGIRDVDQIERRRNAYRVFGVDRRGRDLTVDVDRFNGEIIRVRRG
ncbi:PepSY domain-containing protein [Mongoliimonas terrestris]|uniref:PepSY domain-containing protein n=1 Tax=Mongoliimonas terrestris TaxID=1709001 RepID=UPI000949AA67|nr:PepSY domain-containing protein [Mongoliimonas terrestris]